MNCEGLDGDQKALVRSTASAVLRNGAAFFEWLRTKRQADPSYSFLYGGLGSEYYKWCLANSELAEKEASNEKSSAPVERTGIRNGVLDEPSKKRENDSRSRKCRSRSRSFSRSLSRSVSSRRRPAERQDRVERRRDSPVERRRRDDREIPRRRSRSPDIARRNVRSPRRSPRRRRSPSREYRRSPSPRRRLERSPPRKRHPVEEAWGGPKPRRTVEEGRKQGKLYAWSDDEKGPAEALRAKVALMKQKLLEETGSAKSGA